MVTDPECIFCKIADGTLPSKIVTQDEDLLAFHDIAPQAPVHVLVIPRKHIATINDMRPEDAALLGKIWTRIPGIAAELGVGADGYRVVTNCLARAGQSVYHIHFQLLGGRDMRWPPG